MKLKLFYIGSKSPAWLESVAREYNGKIGQFIQFERTLIKSPSLERSSADQKRKSESDLIFKKIKDSDFVILLDEKGHAYKNSVQFSEDFVKVLSGSQSTVSLIIGGPYGSSDELKERANKVISLSNLTMNHHVAQLALLEQVYRAFAIWKNLPYHN